MLTTQPLMQIGLSILVVCFMFASSYPTQAQLGKVLPVDDGPKDSSFLTFRAQLIKAIVHGDTSYIYGIVDSSVGNGFGGGVGLRDFKYIWSDSSPDGLRDGLLQAIIYGAVLDTARSSFHVPGLLGRWPKGLSAYEYCVLTGNNVHVRSTPNRAGDVVATLSYDIIEVEHKPALNDETGGETRWIEILLADGHHGYVAEQFVLSPIGHRFSFLKKSGEWRLMSWAAGD
jgi:hypothetical protein